MLKTVIAVPCDNSERNQRFLKQCLSSLKKFHPDLEVRVFDNPVPTDKDFWYRATPILAKQLFEEGYEQVIKLDVDQIVLGSLADILDIQTKFDVGVVLNDPTFPIRLWDLQWPYFNNGLVIMRSKEFVDHWFKLCFSPHFVNYQFREQDMLNLLCSDYFDYLALPLEGDKIYGEWAKPNWAKTYLKDNKVMLKLDNPEREVQICMYHSGGGESPDKGNYKIRFPGDVSRYMDTLIK